MEQKAIFTDPETGDLCVITASPEHFKKGGTMAEAVERTIQCRPNCPDNTPYEIINVDQLPPDRTFRNAWKKGSGGNKIDIDFPKAQDITKRRLRAERKPLLEEQDVLFTRAQETGADTSAIVAEKNRLRDITNQVDTATTLDQLKALKAAP